mgnify:CR=1 FL=1
MKWPFRRKPRPPRSPLNIQILWYWRLMAVALLLPVLIPVPYLEQAVPACALISVIFVTWQIARLQAQRGVRSIPAYLIAGLASVFGTLTVAIVIAAIYVIRHGEAVAPATGIGMQVMGSAYILISHFLVTAFVNHRWPIPPESTTPSLAA